MAVIGYCCCCSCERGALLVATWRVFGRGVIRRADSWAAGTSTTGGRRTASLVGATMTVHVGVVVATGRWSGPGIVRIVRVSGARWTILIRSSHTTTWRGASIASLTPIIELARWSASAVVIASRAVATRGTTAVIVVVVGSRGVATTASAHRRTGAVSITTAIIWSPRASVWSPRFEGRRWGRVGDVLGAGDFLTLELTAVQLLYCGLQVGLRLILDEPEEKSVVVIADYGYRILTQCHRARGQLRNRRRPIQTDGQSLLGPMQ